MYPIHFYKIYILWTQVETNCSLAIPVGATDWAQWRIDHKGCIRTFLVQVITSAYFKYNSCMWLWICIFCVHVSESGVCIKGTQCLCGWVTTTMFFFLSFYCNASLTVQKPLPFLFCCSTIKGSTSRVYQISFFCFRLIFKKRDFMYVLLYFVAYRFACPF